MPSEHVSINCDRAMHGFADQIARTIVESAVETGEYRGIGGHGSADHGGHGVHSQISIGLGDKTIDIRKLDR